MFGYVLANLKTLSEDGGKRFRALYCGMCRSLKRRYGQISRFTLSYDMTFLALTLTSLYECEEARGEERCLPHPIKAHPYAENEMIDYAADMNVLLAYQKCRDNIEDDHDLKSAAGSAMLKKAYRKAAEKWPDKAKAIEQWMLKNAEAEKRGEKNVDTGMNLTGAMLGELFVYKDDFFQSELRRMGENLGRFIYFMDAYEDLEKDVQKGRYNALRAFAGQADYEDLCKATLSMVIADCADAFERLPITQDAELIRNILYSGVWARYGYIQNKKVKKTGLKEQHNAGSV